jgi:hypothetical protein
MLGEKLFVVGVQNNRLQKEFILILTKVVTQEFFNNENDV